MGKSNVTAIHEGTKYYVMPTDEGLELYSFGEKSEYVGILYTWSIDGDNVIGELHKETQNA